MSDHHHPVNAAMAFALSKVNLTGNLAESDGMKPAPSQYALKPGHKCVVAGSGARIDREFEVCEILDPAEYAAEYPDWTERIQRSYMLCRYNTSEDPLGDTGWFARVKLVQITDEQYQEIMGWVEGTWPDSPPDWLNEAYDKYDQALADADPDRVPIGVKCENCGHEPVGFIMMHHVHAAATAGMLKEHGKKVYVAMDDMGVDAHIATKLYCDSCEWIKDLNDDDVRINVAHSFGRLLQGQGFLE